MQEASYAGNLDVGGGVLRHGGDCHDRGGDYGDGCEDFWLGGGHCMWRRGLNVKRRKIEAGWAVLVCEANHGQ